MCPEVAISQKIHLWEGKSASKQPCESSNASPDRCGQEPWASVAFWARADAVTAGTFQEHVCLAVGSPGRNSRKPGLGCCQRSIGERRSWLFPLGYTTVPRLLDVAQESRPTPSGDVLLLPSWHVGKWSHQHTDWGVGMSGWPLGLIASVEVSRR